MRDWQSIPVRMVATTPTGDVPISAGASSRVLPGGSGPRTTLTYGPYLESVRRFLLRRSGAKLAAALRAHLGRPVAPKEIERIDIRSEKHGAFYHVARVDVHLVRGAVSLAVNVAAGELAQLTLAREYRLLRRLARHIPSPHLPRFYCQGSVSHDDGHGEPLYLGLAVGEWFKDYHEFHPGRLEGEGRVRLLLWDSAAGHRALDDFQTSSIYRQAARILTEYYDWSSFREIYPWHHGAGDFVARVEGDRVHVRLITVRDYASAVGYRTRKMAGKMLALLLFFLHLTIRMRLDRSDGVGELVWAAGAILKDVAQGFFEGFSGKDGAPSPSALREILSVLSEDEWRQLLAEVLGCYTFSPEELELIHRQGEMHIQQLRRILPSSPG
ncbi:MAG TPA: hypothetical protein VMU60_10475 [Syntrophobacteria bacterium]|nr:hypothetical protein [Syntrophobacteria bacterium]